MRGGMSTSRTIEQNIASSQYLGLFVTRQHDGIYEDIKVHFSIQLYNR